MNTNGKSILIIENDCTTRDLIKLRLEKDGYDTFEAKDGQEGLETFMEHDPCFVLLELMLPDISGEDVCRSIRIGKKSDVPIIMLSAKDNEQDRIRGLKLGADDFVTIPFNPDELVARVEAVLRRTAHRCSKITHRGLTIKPLKGEVHYKGIPVPLTLYEFHLLYLFMRNPNQILTREQIIHKLYPNNEKIVTDRTIDVHIGKLREKLRAAGIDDIIETVRGMGFRFVTY